MSPDKLSIKIDDIVSSFETRFAKQVGKTQGAVFDQIQVLLNRLELNADGTIKQNQANRKILARADEALERALKQSGYYASLDATASSIGALTGVNSAYFKTLVDGFKPSAQYIKTLQSQTITQLEDMLANDGLETVLKAPIRNILNQNINTGASYNDLLKQLRTFITGNEDVEGKLMRYSKQITTDSLFNYSRAFQESVSQKTGLEWVQYVGGAVKDSRNFCLSRMGGYYKKEDVEKWAKQNWAGKREGTTASTIFIYAGGYNCRHQIIYVSEAAVPKVNKQSKELIARAKTVGQELQDMGEKVAKKYNAEITPLNHKGYESMVRKANDELKGNVFRVKDAVRNTIVTDAENIKDVAKDVGKFGVKGLKVQNYDSGYRGYITNPRLSNGVIGEIQVNTHEMIFAKEEPTIAKMIIGEDKWNEIAKKTGLPGGLGHKYYEQDRKIVIDPEKPDPINDPIKLKLKDEIREKSRDYYSKFYYSYPEPWP
ncbi:MAG: hypothetical protein E6Q97_23255 [Desulfurellales bacterium]|nr:MAG: hypothetical protein E6Q97_23255 [Desulfurellales bacterium]